MATKYLLIPQAGQNAKSMTMENVTNERCIKMLERALEAGTLVEFHNVKYYVDIDLEDKEHD